MSDDLKQKFLNAIAKRALAAHTGEMQQFFQLSDEEMTELDTFIEELEEQEQLI